MPPPDFADRGDEPFVGRLFYFLIYRNIQPILASGVRIKDVKNKTVNLPAKTLSISLKLIVAA